MLAAAYCVFAFCVAVVWLGTMFWAASRVARRAGIGLYEAVLRWDVWSQEIILGIRARTLVMAWVIFFAVGWIALFVLVGPNYPNRPS